MAHAHRRQRQDSNEVGDAPAVRHERRNGQDNHGDHTEQRETHTPLEAAQHLRHLLEEVALLGLLARRAPRHVDAEHMAQQRLAHVQRQSAQKTSQHERPLQVLEQAAEPAARADTVAHRGEGDVAEAVEDDDDGEPDFPAVDVVLVEVAVEEADGEVVGDRQDPGGADGVVGADVGYDGDFGGEADVREEELAEEGGEGSGKELELSADWYVSVQDL